MTFSIVHVSDLHFKNDHPCIERIRLMRDDILRQVQNEKCYLIFSGDLVNAGDDNLYEVLLDEFFVHLDEAVEAIYLVAGNHDIQRAHTDADACQMFLNDSSQSYLYEKGASPNLSNPFKNFDPLKNFNDFHSLISSFQIANFFGTQDTNPDFSFVGLNSTWLSHERPVGQSDLGKLKIDPAAVEFFLERIDDSQFKICAMHHPIDWIAESVRQQVQNLLTERFDLVVFGHVHNPSSISGTFNNGECLLLQAPAVKSTYSLGTNAYSIVRVDGNAKKYEIRYRSFSESQRKFVVGSDLSDGGVKYPTSTDERHWHNFRTGTKSGLLERFQEQISDVDFSDWYRKNIVSKGKLVGDFVEPSLSRVEYKDGQEVEGEPKKLADSLLRHTAVQIVTGPQDCGLTTAAFLTVRSLCDEFAKRNRVPAYVSLKNTSIDKASLIRAAVNSSPISYSHAEMTRLIEDGGVIFVFDQIGLPETQKFNRLRQTLERYFSNSESIIFCAVDGGFDEASDTSELALSPLTDVIFELNPLDVDRIHTLISSQKPTASVEEIDSVLQNVISSFKQMDEPLYPSSVAVLLETLRQIPEFRPLNRVRLLDRYVECLLGRFDLEDVEQGTFNSNDKVNFLAFASGYFAKNKKEWISRKQWKDICDSYEKGKLIELPPDLLSEFTEKGILIIQGGQITFRADYLYSYFVAKEMNQNSKMFELIAEDDAFYSHHREIVFYGELEGVDNASLLDATYRRLGVLEEEILETYSRRGVDFDDEWRSLLDSEVATDGEHLSETVEEIIEETPNPETIGRARESDLDGVDRNRGIQSRQTIRELELRWYISIRTYLQLVKHSTNLEGSDKLRHLEKALESSELFIKGLAAKRDVIAATPAYYHSGILYLNPLAETDPERAKREFKFAVPSSFAKIVSDLMSNPQLSPAYRKMLQQESELKKFLARHLLLEAPHRENHRQFVESLTSSSEIVLQTCSLRRLKAKYLGYSVNPENRTFYSGIVESIASDKSLKKSLQHRQLKKERMLKDMKENLSRDNPKK